MEKVEPFNSPLTSSRQFHWSCGCKLWQHVRPPGRSKHNWSLALAQSVCWLSRGDEAFNPRWVTTGAGCCLPRSRWCGGGL